jgi:small subunit ribosomal protein S21
MSNFTIFVKNNDIDKAIRKMKNKTAKLGVLKTYRSRSRYEKPSDKRIRVMKANIINTKLKKRKREKDL